MDLKIIPVVQVLIAVILMFTASKLLPSFAFNWPAQSFVALLGIFVSIIIGISAIISFNRHKTTVNPTKPETSSTIVSSGIYAFSRNPMYLAMLIFLVSLGYYLQHHASLPIILIFIGYMTRFQIIPEEKMLKKLFGQQYIDYQVKVRRWL